MSNRSPLLELPVELRYLIYEDYFTLPGGYVHHFESGRLKDTDGNPLSVGLIFTCKQIADETRPFPFKSNTIIFSTVHFDYANFAAARFSTLLRTIFDAEGYYFDSAKYLLDDEMVADIIHKFPSMIFFPNPSKEYGSWYGIVQDTHNIRQAVTYILQKLCQLYSAARTDESFDEPQVDIPLEEAAQVLQLCHEPWTIPSWDHLNEMSELFPDPDKRLHYRIGKGLNTQKYRFSAAAAAIFFLQSLTLNNRQLVQNIILNEDRRSVPYPECHGHGLIPFCKENPNLRIERRVNLWKNIILEGELRGWEKSDDFSHPAAPEADDAEYFLAQWFLEAQATFDAGMPRHSMTLFLDGNPAPHLASELFQNIFHKRSAWIAARYQLNKGTYTCCPRNFYCRGDELWHNRYNYSNHISFDHFQKGLEELINGTSIRSNFDPGNPLELGPILEEAVGWTYDDWERHGSDRIPEQFELTAPLPTFHDLLKENMYSKQEIRAVKKYGKTIGIYE